MRKKSKLTAGLLALLMALTAVLPWERVKAAEFTPTVPTASVAEMMAAVEAKPGDVLDISLPVRASGYTVRKPIITLNLEETPFELTSDFTFTREDAPANTTIQNIVIGRVTYLHFQLKVKESARNGVYDNMTMKFMTTDSFNEYCEVELANMNLFKIKVTGEKKLPELKIVAKDYPDSIKPTDEFDVRLEFQNMGGLLAKNVKIDIEGSEASGLIPQKLYNTVDAGNIPAGKSVEASFSFTAAKTLTSGVKNLQAVVNYELEDGTVYGPISTNFYIEAVVNEQETPPAANSDVQLVSAKYPKTVKAEQSVNVALKYKNEGSAPVTNVKVQLGGYSEAGFIPDFIYDTVELGDLAAGGNATANFALTAAKIFAAGTKSMTAKVTYTTGTGNTYSDTVSLFMEALEEEPEAAVTNSLPKLLIKDYDLGTEKLMAGSEFVFRFDVLNSHSSAKAANIKVTVSSADNTFSIVEGSSSFLIASIAAGETVSCEIPLKVKGDAATEGYDLTIAFDYEYAAKDENNNDISKSNTLEEKLKIPVYSNDRPKVSNIAVGYYELPKTGELTTMSFEFYNMGKSPLYNVTATVEGDFDAAGNMLMIGNVEPGSGKSWEMDVTPMAEGFGSGTLHITYEDSNGNISTFDETFQSEIQSSMPPMIDDGGMMPGGDGMMGVDGMGVTEAKKPILPMWAFVLVQVVIFVIAAPVTKTILVKRYKKKQLKRLENELDA